MDILFVEESTQSNYDGVDENIEFYYDFFINESLEHILKVHLNSNYGDLRCGDFADKSDFPQYYSRDVYNIISSVLFNLEEEIHFYFSKARKLGEDIEQTQKYSDNLSNIKIQFNSGNYLTFSQAVDNIRTIFLQFIPKPILFKFIKSLIFESNFRYGSEESLFKQSNIFKDTINYTALVYFIQRDLMNITIGDLYKIKNDLLGLNILVNPFFEQQTKAINRVKRLYENLDSIVIKDGKYNTIEKRLQRIFDVYLIINYPSIYFPTITQKITNADIYVELRKLGYKFNEYDTSDISTINRVDASPNISHIASDKKFIAEMQNIDLKVTS